MSEAHLGKRFIGWAVLVVGAAASLAGCQSSAPAPQDMARTSLETAPADLQLVCASAAAGTTGVEGSKVLPTSSRQIDATSYSVDLDAGGRKFTCVVDNTGTVKSVGPAAT